MLNSIDDKTVNAGTFISLALATQCLTLWLNPELRDRVSHDIFLWHGQHTTPSRTDMTVSPQAYVPKTNQQKCCNSHKLRFFCRSVYNTSFTTVRKMPKSYPFLADLRQSGVTICRCQTIAHIHTCITQLRVSVTNQWDADILVP